MYKNMDTMTLRESMEAFPWQDYTWMSFQSNGKVHRKLDEHTAYCGLAAPTTGGFNYYGSITDFHPRARCLRCMPVMPNAFALEVLAGEI
jgi:hypothetical protein